MAIGEAAEGNVLEGRHPRFRVKVEPDVGGVLAARALERKVLVGGV